MIEVSYYYDLLPGVDMQDWVEWASKVIAAILKAPGVVELRSHRNMVGSPLMRTTSVWQTQADWAKFNESAEWQALMFEFRDMWATNIRFAIWGPSPNVPEPLRPG